MKTHTWKSFKTVNPKHRPACVFVRRGVCAGVETREEARAPLHRALQGRLGWQRRRLKITDLWNNKKNMWQTLNIQFRQITVPEIITLTNLKIQSLFWSKWSHFMFYFTFYFGLFQIIKLHPTFCPYGGEWLRTEISFLGELIFLFNLPFPHSIIIKWIQMTI